MTDGRTVECDLVITGGTIVDGTGAAARPGDVGVTGDRIQAVTDAGGLTAPRVIDAAGLVVCPGFIDLHSHADFSIAGHPGADTALAQGVTTLLTGNCGWSPFPLADPDALPRATEFLQPELDWDWTDAAGYAAAVDATEPAVNIALQVGHSSIRLAVLGSDDRPPDEDELVRMRELVAQAADQGVHGFSTGLIYAPGCYADTAEVAALVRAAAEHGLLYSTHMRNESAQLLEAVRETLDTAAAAGARLEISHLKAMGPSNHGAVDEALRLIDRGAADGVDVSCDVYPYTASSTTLTSFLPTWALDGGVDELLARLSEPDTRARVESELRQQLAGSVDPAAIVIADLLPGPHADAVGRSLAEVAVGLDTDAADAALRLLSDHRGAVAIVHHAMADRDVSAVAGPSAGQRRQRRLDDATDRLGTSAPAQLRHVQPGARPLRPGGCRAGAHRGGTQDDVAAGRPGRAAGPRRAPRRVVRRHRRAGPGDRHGPLHVRRPVAAVDRRRPRAGGRSAGRSRRRRHRRPARESAAPHLTKHPLGRPHPGMTTP